MGPVKDRGSDGDINYPGVMYEMRITDAVSNVPMHVEQGMWLLMSPNPNTPQGVVRQSLIPHGDALVAIGTFSNHTCGTNGGPGNCPVIPFLNPVPTNMGNVFQGYFGTPPYCYNMSVDPNSNLRNALQASASVLSYVQIDVSTLNGGGIQNIPFVQKYANATSFNSTYFIETMSDGTMQLQYTQSSNITFLNSFGQPGLIVWPHIQVNTLVKQ